MVTLVAVEMVSKDVGLVLVLKIDKARHLCWFSCVNGSAQSFHYHRMPTFRRMPRGPSHALSSCQRQGADLDAS